MIHASPPGIYERFSSIRKYTRNAFLETGKRSFLYKQVVMPQPINGLASDAKTIGITPGIRSYALIFEDDSEPPAPPTGRTVKQVNSLMEAEQLCLLLGPACEIFVSDTYRQAHPEVAASLQRMAEAEQAGQEVPFDIETGSAIMRRLPLDLKGLMNSPIALLDTDPLPPRIDQNLAHKANENNVLITEPYTTGWVRYFNMLQETEELQFDHPSDHVQGMLMLEALRQAGIASAHLQGLPPEGKLALMVFNSNFTSFVDLTTPVIIRTYCSFTPHDEYRKDREACIFLQIFQSGRVCAETVLKAFACLNERDCRDKEIRLAKIVSGQRKRYVSQVNRIIEQGR